LQQDMIMPLPKPERLPADPDGSIALLLDHRGEEIFSDSCEVEWLPSGTPRPTHGPL